MVGLVAVVLVSTYLPRLEHATKCVAAVGDGGQTCDSSVVVAELQELTTLPTQTSPILIHQCD
mgnify:CR=1 FL=1